MARLFYHVMQDNAGNLLFDVTGTMRVAGSGTLATIYGDAALTVILPNPMTNHPSFGSFKCYLGAGSYDFYMAKGGYTFETLTGVQGHGTMAQQDASAVAITGGSATLTVASTVSANPAGAFGFTVYPGSTYLNKVAINGVIGDLTNNNLFASGNVYLGGPVGIGTAPYTNGLLQLRYTAAGTAGLHLRPSSDSGPPTPLLFVNAAATIVGSITQTASATAYNTSSDQRLKHAITALTGALDRIRALRPVHYLWNANDEPGEGFLAHELMREVPLAVTGEPDALNDDGTIRPQGVDHSKIVPHLTAALQELAAQVQALTAKVATLEAQLA